MNLLNQSKDRFSYVHKTTLITGPTSEPVTLQEAQDHLNFRSGQEDYIYSLIVTARVSLERYLNRALITQEWKVFYDCWHNVIQIPFGNLRLRAADVGPPEVVKRPLVKYYNTDGDLITLDEAGFYWVVTTTDPARIVKKHDAVYPQLQQGRPDAIEITFLCGFADSPTDVPAPIKHAMKLLITDYFENKGTVVLGSVNKIPGFVTDLVHTYKLYEF